MPSKKPLPHHGVYARIRRSKIHGVGVVAIRDIKKGTRIFFGDDDPIVWIKRKQVMALPREIKKLYEDFCIFRGDKVGCPSNFNRLTVAWYLNESHHPNVGNDEDYAFYALRNIKAGEELTLDYSKFSDSPGL